VYEICQAVSSVDISEDLANRSPAYGNINDIPDGLLQPMP